MTLIQKIDDLAACCFGCGSFFRTQYGLCRNCFDGLNPHRWHSNIEKADLIENGSAASLSNQLSMYSWPPDQCPALNALMLALKGGRFPKISKAWGKLLAQYFYSRQFAKNRHLEALGGNGQVLVLHPPPSLEGLKDHSYFLAKGFSEYLSYQMASVFKTEKTAETKGQTRVKRQELRFSIENLEALGDKCGQGVKRDPGLNFRTIILIDDIITTGSTMKAMEKCLKYENIYMVSLAHRSLFGSLVAEGL